MEHLIQSEEQQPHQKWPKDSIVGAKPVTLLTAGVTSRRHEVETNHEFDISLMPADTAAQSETAVDREPTDTASVSCS